MPIARFEMPDGRIARFEVPEGTTPEQAQALITRSLAAAEGRTEQINVNPSEGGGTLQFGPFDTGIRTPQSVDRFLAGAGQAFSALGTGASQVGAGVLDAISPQSGQSRVDKLRQEVVEQRRLDAPLNETTAGKVGNFTGNVAAFAPTAFIPGANTITGAGLIGAASGLLQPSASSSETMSNVGLGAAASAAVPLTLTGFRTARSFIEPFYQRGRDRIVGNALNSAAGGEAAAAQARLASSGSLVPGSLPTVGEAAQVPSLAALQRTASAVNPNVTNQMAARQIANNEARIEALRRIIGDPDVAKSAREAAANALYSAANGKTVVITPELDALLKRPSMVSAVGNAANLAREEGRALSLKASTPPKPSMIVGSNGQPMSVVPGQPGSMLTQDAHTIKRALDDSVEGLAGATGLGKNARRATIGTREAFLGEVEKQVPEYGAARTTFAQMSRPVNQSEVADLILKRSLGNNVQGQITPAAFKRALSDRTAQSALGRKGATLADTFDATQMGTLRSIMDDLGRLDFASRAGRDAGSDTVQKLAYTNMLDRAGVPTFMRQNVIGGTVGNLAQRAAQIGYKDANERLAEQLALTMLNPKLAAELMRKAAPKAGLLALENGVRRAMVPMGGVMPGLLSENLE